MKSDQRNARLVFFSVFVFSFKSPYKHATHPSNPTVEKDISMNLFLKSKEVLQPWAVKFTLFSVEKLHYGSTPEKGNPQKRLSSGCMHGWMQAWGLYDWKFALMMCTFLVFVAMCRAEARVLVLWMFSVEVRYTSVCDVILYPMIPFWQKLIHTTQIHHANIDERILLAAETMRGRYFNASPSINQHFMCCTNHPQ